MRRALVAVALVVGLVAACAPPPPSPIGILVWKGQQSLALNIGHSDGTIVHCELRNEIQIDLGYTRMTVHSKLFPGPQDQCGGLRAWTGARVLGSCVIGTIGHGAVGCGGPYGYPLAANGTVGTQKFDFTRKPPAGGRLVHDFLAVVTFGGVRASVEVRGETPIIRCEGAPIPVTQRVCKFAS